MLKDKKVIIFDMDGTLIDSVGIWNQVDEALIQRIRENGKSEIKNVQRKRDEVLRKNDQANNPYIEYCTYLKKAYQSTLSVQDIHALRYEIAQDYLYHVVDYKEGAELFIKSLKELGYQLVIASTTKRTNMDVYRKHNHRIISKANIDDYFTLVYTREDAKAIKPNPEIYLRVMKDLKVSRKDCLVFEDSLIGVEAAKNAGIECVVIEDQYSDAEREQINQLADYQIKSYLELLVVQIGKLHRRTHFNFALVHKVEQFRYKICQSDISANLFTTFANFIAKNIS